MDSVKFPPVDMSLDHARTVLTRAAFASDEDLRVAAQYLVDYGDWMDHGRGVAVLRQLEARREAAEISAPEGFSIKSEQDETVHDLLAFLGLIGLGLCAYLFADLVVMFDQLIDALLTFGWGAQ